jgi:hypothetical protein
MYTIDSPPTAQITKLNILNKCTYQQQKKILLYLYQEGGKSILKKAKTAFLPILTENRQNSKTSDPDCDLPDKDSADLFFSGDR